MFRRLIWMGTVAMWLLAVLPQAVAGAAAPEDPRLATVVWNLRPTYFGLVSTDQLGGTPETLFARSLGRPPTPFPLSAPSWSPDGRMLAFTAIAARAGKGKSSSVSRTKIFVVPAEGGEPRPVPGTAGGATPVFSPDGRAIAFAVSRRRQRRDRRGAKRGAGEREAIWLANLDGTKKARLTPWRSGLRESPSSFSPNGKTLAATRQLGKKASEAVAIGLASGKTTVLAHRALEPVYSPDGSEIAFLKGRSRTVSTHGSRSTATVTDLFVMRPDGSELGRLTHTPKAVELYPRWDPSGSRLAFTRLDNPFTEAGFPALDGAIMEVNSDGTCSTKVLTNNSAIYSGATWQPGPGRGAGPIAC